VNERISLTGHLQQSQRLFGTRGRRETLQRPSARVIAGVLAAIPLVSSLFPAAAAATLILLPVKAWVAYSKWIKVILAASGLSVLAMLISGFASPAGPYWTQILGVGVFALCFLGYMKLVDRVASLATVLASAGAATTLYVLLVGWDGSHEISTLWKYGIALPFSIFLLYFACRGSSRLMPLVLLGGLALLSLIFEYRSFSGVCLSAVIAWLFHSRAGTGKWWLLRAGSLGGLLILGFNLILAAIESGAFGDSLRSKTIYQLEGGGPALLSGRVEPPLSWAAISERPLQGWGNPQNLGSETFALGGRFAKSIGMYDLSAYQRIWLRQDGRVSLHSILFESWVSGGALAALLPIALIVLFVVAVFRASGRFYPLIALVSIQGLWDVLFSPWAGNRSVLLALSALVAVFSIHASVSSKALKPTPAPRRLSS
jgi:hypothetical protein